MKKNYGILQKRHYQKLKLIMIHKCIFFKNIRNNAEKPFLVQAVLNGAEQAGYTDGILFLNYE